MADVDGLAGPGAGKSARQAPEVIGSVADFIEIVNETAGKHFKCCICFRSVGSFASHTLAYPTTSASKVERQSPLLLARTELRACVCQGYLLILVRRHSIFLLLRG